MIRKGSLLLVVGLLIAAAACSKQSAGPQLTVEIPSGFSGNVVVEMGLKGAAPLAQQGDAYVVSVPRDGKIETSTVLLKPNVTFKNSTDGSVWGYSESNFTTGDGISVGGKIEFFVGTRKEFEAEQGRKNHSGAISSSDANAGA